MENHKKPVECLKKDITIKNVVIVGEKISSVGSINQLLTFWLHGLWMVPHAFVLISVSMQRERDELVDGPYRRDFLTYDNHILDGDIFLQALNGFLMILDCNGELFFATHTIETYLGFHQSDVIHQSVYELVHSEDREELQRQLGMCKDF